MMTIMFRLIGALGAVMVTTAAVPTCSKDSSASASTQSAANATVAPNSATTAGPGLPAEFPLAPGLSACKAVVTGPEIICDWHGVDGHAIYTFYHDALPKAGYSLLPGAQEATTPSYLAAIGFTKGDLKGSLVVSGTNLTIQIIRGQ